jgi:uncharacterized membrane-anchored protein
MKVKIKGVARLDRRTKNLISRVCRGEIAILDHEDIDEVACDALILARVRGVVNVKSSITGKYYNPGPLNLCDAGIRLLDCVGPRVMEAVRDGDVVEIIGNTLRKNGTIICQGTILEQGLPRLRICLSTSPKQAWEVPFLRMPLNFQVRIRLPRGEHKALHGLS